MQTLFGLAHVKGSWAGNDYTENDYALSLSSSLDVNLNNMVSLRPVQLDYFTTKSGNTGDFADHFTFSTGFVIKLGKR